MFGEEEKLMKMLQDRLPQLDQTRAKVDAVLDSTKAVIDGVLGIVNTIKGLITPKSKEQ